MEKLIVLEDNASELLKMKTCKTQRHQYSMNLKKCPDCAKEAQKRYYSKNKIIRLDYYQNNKEIIKTKNREKRAVRNKTSIQWYNQNKERHLKNNQQWRETHKNDLNYKAKNNANVMKRHAAKLKATPKWLTIEQTKEIELIYLKAKELSWLNENGEIFHVDHIVPLQGKDVCGLHVPWNLQILTKSQNCSKQNKVG